MDRVFAKRLEGSRSNSLLNYIKRDVRLKQATSVPLVFYQSYFICLFEYSVLWKLFIYLFLFCIVLKFELNNLKLCLQH